MKSLSSSDNIRSKILEIIEYYNGNTALSLIPVLNMIQDTEGYIKKERIKEIAEILKINENRIYETLTFYHFLTLDKSEKRILYVCRGISCLLEGADEIIEYLKDNRDRLNFDFRECECIGLCDFAPAGLFDFNPVKNLDVKKIKELNEKV
ncbi:MAG: NAD(P)H-dependent oxidoreductase subunit E [Candidatus Hydrothermales bacterium]